MHAQGAPSVTHTQTQDSGTNAHEHTRAHMGMQGRTWARGTHGHAQAQCGGTPGGLLNLRR
eukprot:222363-Alexandrium_andersonii.AAC.1